MSGSLPLAALISSFWDFPVTAHFEDPLSACLGLGNPGGVWKMLRWSWVFCASIEVGAAVVESEFQRASKLPFWRSRSVCVRQKFLSWFLLSPLTIWRVILWSVCCVWPWTIHLLYVLRYINCDRSGDTLQGLPRDVTDGALLIGCRHGRSGKVWRHGCLGTGKVLAL